MGPRDVYCLAIRLGGVGCFAVVFFDLTHVISTALNLPLPSRHSVATGALSSLWWFIGGLLLTIGAGPLTRLVYGSKKSN